VLSYAEDASSPKCVVARDLLRSVRATGVISTQVIQEFYVNLTGKYGAAPAHAAGLIRALRRFEIVLLDVDRIEEATELHATGQISFWDALIVSAAAFAHCDVLYTEDLGHGMRWAGVQVVNPFV